MDGPIFIIGSLNRYELNFLKTSAWLQGRYDEYEEPEDIPDDAIITDYYGQLI